MSKKIKNYRPHNFITRRIKMPRSFWSDLDPIKRMFATAEEAQAHEISLTEGQAQDKIKQKSYYEKNTPNIEQLQRYGSMPKVQYAGSEVGKEIMAGYNQQKAGEIDRELAPGTTLGQTEAGQAFNKAEQSEKAAEAIRSYASQLPADSGDRKIILLLTNTGRHDEALTFIASGSMREKTAHGQRAQRDNDPALMDENDSAVDELVKNGVLGEKYAATLKQANRSGRAIKISDILLQLTAGIAGAETREANQSVELLRRDNLLRDSKKQIKKQ